MVSRKDDAIDFNKLEAEVNAAVDADARYQRENDAKFRAVHQKVATYDEFRDIVLASHIQPLEKGDLLKQEVFKQQWNVQASTFKTGATSEHEKQSDVFTKKKFDKVPKNGHEFTKDWRRHCKTAEDKYQCLLELGAANLGVIFKPEVGFGLLGEFIQVLFSQFKNTDGLEIVQILAQLSKTNRFQLNLDFLSAGEKNTCKQLFEKIDNVLEADSNQEERSAEALSVQSILASLKNQYGMDAS